MAAIYSNGDNRWNILGFNFTKRDALSSVYKISMYENCCRPSELLDFNVLYLGFTFLIRRMTEVVTSVI